MRINSALCAINGRPRELHIGRRLDEVLPEMASVLVPIYQHVLESGEPVLERELTAEQPGTGHVRHVLASWFPVRVDGEIAGVGAVVIDITDLKAAEMRLEGVLRQLPVGVVIADAAGQVLLTNGRLGEMGMTVAPNGTPPRRGRVRRLARRRAALHARAMAARAVADPRRGGARRGDGVRRTGRQPARARGELGADPRRRRHDRGRGGRRAGRHGAAARDEAAGPAGARRRGARLGARRRRAARPLRPAAGPRAGRLREDRAARGQVRPPAGRDRPPGPRARGADARVARARHAGGVRARRHGHHDRHRRGQADGRTSCPRRSCARRARRPARRAPS